MHKPVGIDAAEGARTREAAENYSQRAAEVNSAARCIFTARGLKKGRAFVGKQTAGQGGQMDSRFFPCPA